MSDGQYFAANPQAAHRRRTVTMMAGGTSVELVTDAAVFSPKHLDPGTAVLLGAAPDPPLTGVLFDLGCGYGPIAVDLARRSPDATVWAVDVNTRALDLCRENAERLGLTNIVVADPDAVPADLRFAALWSNPPVRVGKQALHELLEQWLPRLDDGAAAVLVIHRHLGGDSLHTWLEKTGYAVTRLASKRGYRVLQAIRS